MPAFVVTQRRCVPRRVGADGAGLELPDGLHSPSRRVGGGEDLLGVRAEGLGGGGGDDATSDPAEEGDVVRLESVGAELVLEGLYEDVEL